MNEPPIPPTDVPPAEPTHEDGALGELLAWSIEAEVETAHEATRAEAERGLVRRVAVLVAGFTLVIVGIFLLVLPGPGLITIAAGLALLSRDVPFARRWLAVVRRRIPEDEDGEVAVWVIVVSAVVGVASIGGSLGWVFLH